jgi:hypothetical protein
MKQTGFKIISPAEWAGNYPSFIADGKSNIADNYGIYHLPESIGFVDYNNNISTRIPNGQILATIDSKIASQGYAVVTLHAQDFRQKVNGVQIDVLNQTEINDLNSLMDSINSKNYHIRTFNQVIQFKQITSTTTTLKSSANPSVVGQKITFTASVVRVLPSSGIPTGTVTFTIDNIVQPPVTLSSTGKAALAVSTLSKGPHSITAQYLGDGNYLSSSSTILSQSVN